MSRRATSLAVLAALAVLTTACTSLAPARVTLVTHDSFAASDPIIADFEVASGAQLDVLKGGDAGAVVNQAILTKSNPLGDVLYGIDNTFLSRALDEGIFEPYVPAAATDLPAELNLDPAGHRVTPIDYGDVCINYDKDAFAGSLGAPATIDRLTDAAYRDQLVVENPATSSPGLAFMLATIVRFGESGDYTWLDYWRDLRANGVLVVSGWEEAYYSSFSGGSGEGDRPLVVSYATSPAAEVYFADPQPAEPPTGNIDDGCFRQIEFVGVLAGAEHPALARQLVDFMLSPEFQADIPLNMFVFPARNGVQLPAVFSANAAKVSAQLTLDPALIAANRERWLEQWTDAVLH
jgi:thiamine transport system substrate-binding protein